MARSVDVEPWPKLATMTLYRLVVHWGTGTADPEAISVDLEREPAEGKTVEADGRTFLVISRHIPADQTSPEPNAFNVRPVNE